VELSKLEPSTDPFWSYKHTELVKIMHIDETFNFNHSHHHKKTN